MTRAHQGREARADRQDRRDARRDARRTYLLEAAIGAIRAEGPGVSMDRMAAAAGVTKPILYRNFGDRAGLTAAIAEHVVAEVIADLDRALHADVTPRELVTSTIDTYLGFIESDPSLYRFIVHRTIAETQDPGQMFSDYLSRIARQVALVLGEGLRAAGLDSGPAEPWAYGMVGMVHAAGDWWLERGSLPRGRLAEYLTALLYDGLPDVGGLGTASTWLTPALTTPRPPADAGPATAGPPPALATTRSATTRSSTTRPSTTRSHHARRRSS